MRTEERLRKIRDWTYETVCKGRIMKAPAPNMDISQIVRQEPKAFIGYAPTRPDLSLYSNIDPLTAAPGIIIAPVSGDVHYMEEKRFDRYNKVHRSQDMGQSLTIQNMFMVFEDGVRLPGFIDAVEAGEEFPMEKLREGTEEGLFTLTNWMDDYKDALLSAGRIPGTDLSVNDELFEYGWYSDQKFISDRRPMFIGMVTVKFQCYADHLNQEIQDLLK